VAGRTGRGRPLAELTVTLEDRATLERWTTRRKTAHGLAVRAQIVLRCSGGCSNSQVARELRLTNATVGKWRSRFVAEGVAGLLDEPRSGAPRRISDDVVEAVIVKTLESTPRDATHWSRASMAAESGLSRSTMNDLIAARPFERSSVAQTTIRSARSPEVTKIFSPLRTYSSPSRTAVVRIAAESEPAGDTNTLGGQTLVCALTQTVAECPSRYRARTPSRYEWPHASRVNVCEVATVTPTRTPDFHTL